MNQETNNEIDLLLRRLARRDDAIVSDADHLDADELNAYAENALPAAARTRYTAHLAECSRCRELVVQLSSSAGVVVATESAKVAGPSGWKKFLASLFTPMVLRYAAPALGLILVAAIGFVILRSNQPARDIAQVTNTERPAALPTKEPEVGVNYGFTKPAMSPDELSNKQVRGVQAESPVQNAAPVVSSEKGDLAKDAAATPKPEQQTKAANELPPPPRVSATPAPEESPRAAETEDSKKEVREQPAAAPAAGKTLRADEQREDKDKAARPRKSADIATQGAGSVFEVRRDSFGLLAEARTVAGRRFRKQGGVWIDTAYDASKEVVTVRRGSEQYRGLVADEPAIKAIADTLEGEIIVVWKGHTYRIR
jgi:hypothetical protein